ncbi:TPA: glycosyltransferase family 2 protein [Candidatus Woesearchaeota archaeon]|nr:glycosyltransferase family 2 protein [Candidatus Woesearchaeota archaeon]HIH32013.1 glycosyltransferase family 2 protein [Candidatus Woesearchaeota archaeon]HIH54448.1 glycosyltransferase family 2 protein [Candidatus Woesearchaeota archaeon]HIJ01514.1 glycosyltransferase family 2 protein [Candidatus Woesearchaeota archaeon]HIJ13733.1 glycosyltransferase family 2 protein [Candidatus Woesearchaeota archaeon]
MNSLASNLSLGIITLPSRKEYLFKLLESVKSVSSSGIRVNILINAKVDNNGAGNLENAVKEYPNTTVTTYNSETYSIPEARNKILSICETPLIGLIDDDCTIHGEHVFENLVDTLKKTNLAMIGLKSYVDDSDVMFKPRKTTPKEVINGVTYMKIEGLFALAYSQLLRDVGGFNERKRFWMEWTDINTVMHRNGYPTGLDMNAGYLRHWMGAPDSATRGRKDRVYDVIYGLLATGLEFGCDYNVTELKMWEMAESTFLKYENENDIKVRELLPKLVTVLPRIIRDAEKIKVYGDRLKSLPFNIMPFENITREQWLELTQYASHHMQKYKSGLL